jgi:hypothetical protein
LLLPRKDLAMDHHLVFLAGQFAFLPISEGPNMTITVTGEMRPRPGP